MRRAGGALAALFCLLAVAAPADARGLTTGVMDFAPFEGTDNGAWYSRAADSGVGIVRLTAAWSSIATRRPANPRDPFDAAYNWTTLDSSVRGAADHGIRAFITAQYAPTWAEGAGRPKSALRGSWKPDPAAYADFMDALARRYDGAHGLPRVSLFQPWNEPNLPRYLSPQWRKGKAFSPGWYRRMLNGAYARVKAVHPDNLVVAAGTAPYGDPPSVNNRMTPVRFLRTLLARRTSLDAIDHHPYATGSPTDHALLGENVAIPDLGKLVRVLRKAERRHTARPAGRKRVWVTEISWDSRPPDPHGVPEAKRARWLQDSLYSLWRQGADTICWFLLRDQAPVPSYDMTYQSGLYTRAGTAKRSATAFRLPIVLTRKSGRTRIWGHTSVAGPVIVERRQAGAWKAIAGFTPSGGVYQGRVKAPRGAQLRARQGAATGLVRKVP